MLTERWCRLKVYHYSTQRVEELTATDPYSRGLSADGGRAMFVDLEQDTALMPPSWLEHSSPAIPGAHDQPHRSGCRLYSNLCLEPQPAASARLCAAECCCPPDCSMHGVSREGGCS